MLIKMIKYEMVKRWKSVKYILMGYVLFQTLLLIIIRSFFWNDGIPQFIIHNNDTQQISVSFAITMLMYLAFAIFIGVYPFFESIFRFGRDISGKQSILELMIPMVSWKKITAKLLATIFLTIIGGVLGIFTIIAFMLINGNFDKGMIDSILIALREIVNTPIKSILAFSYLFFGIGSFYMLFFFCIAFSKSFSHKNKIAVPIGIVTFIFCVFVLVILDIQAERYPLFTYIYFGVESYLSSNIIDILAFVVLFFGTSWLMEKRIEH